ncbi:potassium channel family protein [Reichenbachiella sp. 5M10]|uniref:potassium channel family protein n=1 Tax=Reichenbachiella sp. 5M10 TaxID=1889772 RepID=UPI001C86CC82|nr:potassium channel family protein [Reichenbachiella sp. 5M10]
MLFHTKYKEHPVMRYRYIILFVVILGKLFIPVILNSNLGNRYIDPLFDVLLFWASMLIVQKLRRAVMAIGVLGAVGLLFNFMGRSTDKFGLCLFSIFIAIVTYELFRDLVGKKSIQINEIVGAMDGYILVGYIGSLMFLLIHLIYPNAFSNVSPGRAGMSDLIYFSFVTMLTIGYGDIVPQVPAARSLVIMIGLVGQFYLVIVIATFVGKFLMNSSKRG